MRDTPQSVQSDRGAGSAKEGVLIMLSVYGMAVKCLVKLTYFYAQLITGLPVCATHATNQNDK